MKYSISPPPMNPIARLVTAFFAALTLLAAFFFGLAVLIVLAGAFCLFVLVFYLRWWWLGRAAAGRQPTPTGSAADGKIIEAEYTVVSRRRN